MNCGINEFWNGAARVRLVLRNCVHLGAKQLSVQGQPPFGEGGEEESLRISTAELDHDLQTLKCFNKMCYFYVIV